MFYKYLCKEHLEQFRRRGTLKIGTIELYREIENKAICDPFEGRTVYSIETKEEAVDLSVEQVNAITNDYHITAKFRIGPYSYFRDSLKVPNAYTFCVSRGLSQQLMSSLGYDAFYAITDMNSFMKIIYAELDRRQELLFSVADWVRYLQTKIFEITNANKDEVIRTTPYNRAKSERIKTIYIEDYFSKLDNFRHQEEFRIVFIPVTPIPKEFLLLDCETLLDYCDFG